MERPQVTQLVSMKQKLLDIYEENMRRIIDRKQEANKELSQRLPKKPPMYKNLNN